MSDDQHSSTASDGGGLSDGSCNDGSRNGGHDASQPRIIALLNQKGGVGKTTTAVNLGAALALQGHRVLLIDLDPQAHLTLHLGVDPETLDHTLYDLLTDDTGQVTAMGMVQQVGGYANLAVLPAETNLAGVESELAPLVAVGAAQTVLRNRTRDLVSQFDYVLIDCPPSLGLLTINALVLAREVIVPMQAHFLALQGLSKLLETVSLIRQSVNEQLSVAGVVLCMHEGQTILAGEVIADLSTFLDAARLMDVPWRNAVVYQPPVRRNIKLAESPSFGQSIFGYAENCPGARDYERLAVAVHGQGVGVGGGGGGGDDQDGPSEVSSEVRAKPGIERSPVSESVTVAEPRSESESEPEPQSVAERQPWEL